jgi:hypothetical protein
LAIAMTAEAALAAPAGWRCSVEATRVRLQSDQADIRWRGRCVSGWRLVVSGEGSAGFYREEQTRPPGGRAWHRALFTGLGPGTRYFLSIEELSPPSDAQPFVYETSFFTRPLAGRRAAQRDESPRPP